MQLVILRRLGAQEILVRPLEEQELESVIRRNLGAALSGVESDIASVAEVFALQGDEHMRKLEKAYLR